MPHSKKGSPARKDPSKALGKSRARLFILEYMISRYDDKVSHYEIVSRMHLPPIGIKRQDQIEHHISELEDDLGLLTSDYIKSGTSSIKAYRLKDDEASRIDVLSEILESPNRLELFNDSYFRNMGSKDALWGHFKRWQQDLEEMLRRGLSLARGDYGDTLPVEAHFDDVLYFVRSLLSGDGRWDIIGTIPILTYMLIMEDEGARRFWLFVNDICQEYPELFTIERDLMLGR